jgi:hypothetical protein
VCLVAVVASAGLQLSFVSCGPACKTQTPHVLLCCHLLCCDVSFCAVLCRQLNQLQQSTHLKQVSILRGSGAQDGAGEQQLQQVCIMQNSSALTSHII